MQPSEIIPTFLRICPDFLPVWEHHRKFTPPGETLYYLDMARLARFVVDSFIAGSVQCFDNLFDNIERLLLDDNEDVRALITIGLLEDIQTYSTHYEFGPDAFLQWLKPLSRQAWFEIARRWEGKTSLMEVIREEMKQQDQDNV